MGGWLRACVCMCGRVNVMGVVVVVGWVVPGVVGWVVNVLKRGHTWARISAPTSKTVARER